MKYLIMNALNLDNINRLPEPVGVLRLDYKTATAMGRLIERTQQPLDATPNWDWKTDPYIHLVSSEFTGPAITGITSLASVKLTKNQKAQYEKNRHVVINDKPVDLVRPAPNQSNLFITMYQQVYWRFPAGDNSRYEVIGPPTTKWKRIVSTAINHLLTEASKKPLTWEEAWNMLTAILMYPNNKWYEMDQRGEYDPELIVPEIRKALDPDQWHRNKLTPVEIAILETTQQQYKAK
jgi:hypothetical protein